MYLKALEIQGFKSFPDRTVLTFGEDITAIVGPNGSGKSNVADAIRWVMGEQSTRALRGGKMEDVIFGGTAQRRQRGFAEVSLILDNTGHTFPLEEPEVMVSRRLYRSGESEYRINRRSVRLRDVAELFMGTGLGREGYSIIGQGRIEEILSARSTDRRGIFEEAAGISRFRHRKEEAERKLERVEEDLLRVNDRISELEMQVEPLREQSEKARRYLALQGEIRSLEISVWLDRLENLRAGAIRLEAEYAEACRLRDGGKERQEAAFAAAEAFSARMQEKDREADRVRSSLQELQNRIGALESALAALHSSVLHNGETAARLEQELERQETRENSLGEQLAQRKRRLEEIGTELAAQRETLGVRETEAREAARSAEDLVRDVESMRAQANREEREAAGLRENLSGLRAAARELRDRDEALVRAEEEWEKKRTAARSEEEAALQETKRCEEARDGARGVISGYQLRAENRRRKMEESRAGLEKLRARERELASRIALLTEMEKASEGFQKAVRTVLKEAERGALSGVHGPVARLLKVPEAYTLALETALGGAMQHIVVDREEDGREIIRFLQRRDGGRVTILPLSAMRPAVLREAEKVAAEPGFVGIGDRLIVCEERYRTLFSSLLGRVVIMEDLDTAIAVARRYGYAFRMVTLDGQVLNAGGSMTGGSASRGTGILSRANELERLNLQREELAGRIQEEEQSFPEVEQACDAAAAELETARDALRHREQEFLRADARLEFARTVLGNLDGQAEERRRERERLAARTGRMEAEQEDLRSRAKAKEESAAALREKAEERRKDGEQLRRRETELTGEVAALRAALAALEAEQGTARSALEELNALRENLAGDREKNRLLLADVREKNESCQREIGEKDRERTALREECGRQEEQLERLQRERVELEGERNRASRTGQAENAELLRLQQDVARLEQRKSAASMEEKQLLDRMWETYGLSHEAARQQKVEIESVSRAERRVAQLKKQLSALGEVNTGAIAEFERVNGRYAELTEQRDDVVRSKEELETILAGITGEMKNIFVREFTAINTAFGQTFQELFGGGRATLELENPEDVLGCGIEIRVQPPGKSLKILSLLSGGEKAFVAIALCFAILKVRPAPFVVMDEIEAALDDSNVTRFASYMRSMAERTQFIVITHRRGTMEEADALYGVTMQEKGVSRVLGISLNEATEHLRPEEQRKES